MLSVRMNKERRVFSRSYFPGSMWGLCISGKNVSWFNDECAHIQFKCDSVRANLIFHRIQNTASWKPAAERRLPTSIA